MDESKRQDVDHHGLLREAMRQTATERAAAGAGSPAPTVEELAARFPEFEILELIGRGGMGAVYKAVQRQLDRTVAIKVMPPELAADPEFGERFLREARALATLDHPQILTVHDFGERDGQFFLVTEFVDGVNLRQLMAMGELSAAEALRIAPQICTALQFAHERGVVHRDIKPENILIDVRGQVKIADFGLAKVARPGDPVALTRSTAVFGTPHYMAPEQFRGTAGVDHRADIYSLGVVLYEMLTGQLPLGHFDPPSSRGGVPRGLDEVVRRALAQQPEKRYQHARDVQSDVERHARDLGRGPATAASATAASAATATAAGGRVVKGPFVAIAAVLLAVVAIGFAVFLVESGARAESRYSADLRRYEADAHAVAELVRAGGPVAEPLPRLPAPPAPRVVDLDGGRILAVGIGASTLLLVLALGFGAIRRIRNSRGERTGIGLAVVTAWIVPLGIVDGLAFAPVASIRGNDLQVVVGLLFGSLLAAANVWFLVWETRRQRRLVEGAVAMRAGGGWILATALLAAAGFATSTLAAWWLGRATPAAAMAPRGATIAADLLGASRGAVLARLGPPLDITVTSSMQEWAYAGPGGQRVGDALVFAAGTVAAFDREAVVLFPTDSHETPHVGQSVAELVAAFGPPVDRATGALTTTFTFGNGAVASVHDGIVVGLDR